MNLNQAKFNSIYNGLSNVVKKTYEAVPKQTKWDANQIQSELIRLGVASNLATTMGCLNTLVSSGLISEPTRGTFIQLAVKQKSSTPIRQTLEVEKSDPTAMDTLFAIAAKMKHLGELANDIAKELEESALVVTEELEAESEDTKKLRQLQQILKSLG